MSEFCAVIVDVPRQDDGAYGHNQQRMLCALTYLRWALDKYGHKQVEPIYAYHRSHEPGFPYFSTGKESATAAAELVILASPFAPILTTGGIDFPVLTVGTGGEFVCLCFEDTTEITPPPITAPAAK